MLIMLKKISDQLHQHLFFISILVFFLMTAILQGSTAFMRSSHEGKVTFFVILLFIYLIYFYYLYKTNQLTLNNKLLLILVGGLILRSMYVVLTGVNERQHDEGYFTTLSDGLVNPGHLGYVEYFCKFHHLPDFSPYKLFSYYHPPLHHIICAFFIRFNLLLGVSETLAFENIQALTMLYSSLCILVAIQTVKKLNLGESGLCLAVSFVSFFPGLIYMSGSVNNDMLSTLFTFLCFYFAVCWMKEKSLANLLKISLCLGFGMISKLTTAVMAFPLAAVFLIYLIQEIRQKRTWICIRNYAVFLLLTASIGLSFVIRNLLFYNTNPGVPVLTESSVLYLGNHSFYEIFGLPASLTMDYPFHTINASQTSNAWLILLRTSIFAEIRPANLSDFMMVLCRAAFLLTLVSSVVTGILLIYHQIKNLQKQNQKDLSIFMLTGYVAVLLTFILFIIKYPYTCSADFRYVAIITLFSAVTIYQVGNADIQSRFGKLIKSVFMFLTGAMLVLTTTVFLFWNQW